MTVSAFGIEHDELLAKSLTSSAMSTGRAVRSGARGARGAGHGVMAVSRTAAKTSRGVAFADKHPQAVLAAGVLHPLALAHARRVEGALRIRRAAGLLEHDPARTTKLVRDLAPSRTPELPETRNPLKLLRAGRRQGAVHRAAVAANSDVKRVTPAAELWSSTFGQASKIRRSAAAGDKIPSVSRHVLRPGTSARASAGHTLANMVDHSGGSPELHRSMHMAGGHRVGDHLDFGRLSAWTTDKKVAQRTGQAHDGAARLPRLLRGGAGGPAGGSATMYRRDGGQAANLSGATRHFTQNEWLAGGRHRVTSVPTKEHPYYGVTPVSKAFALSAFGVAG